MPWLRMLSFGGQQARPRALPSRVRLPSRLLDAPQAAIQTSLSALLECLAKDGGCAVVPGVSDEQWAFCFLTRYPCPPTQKLTPGRLESPLPFSLPTVQACAPRTLTA
jgi:hypothetical protein